MQIALPKFQYRFVPSLGNVIHPGNFHPVGTQRSAEAMLARAAAHPHAGRDDGRGAWVIVGGSGGFGSAARAVLGGTYGAPTLNVSFDPTPAPESNNKIRKLGSPGFHRSLALERELGRTGVLAHSLVGDAFSPALQDQVIAEIRERFGGKIRGLVWALAAPRATDPRTGKTIASALRPLGKTVAVKNFSAADPEAGVGPRIGELEIPPGTPEEAIQTIFVMGGGIVSRWIERLLSAGVLAEGFELLTISYRGNPLNEGIYRQGLIGLAKADLEFETGVLDARLANAVGGRALAVLGPAVVTEASGGIPGVPLYLAHLQDVMQQDFEDPLASMLRLFTEKLGATPVVDEAGLVRMDDRELTAAVQGAMAERYTAATVGSTLDLRLYELFMREYARTRGFEVEGVDYDAEFDSDAICR